MYGLRGRKIANFNWNYFLYFDVSRKANGEEIEKLFSLKHPTPIFNFQVKIDTNVGKLWFGNPYGNEKEKFVLVAENLLDFGKFYSCEEFGFTFCCF